MALKCSLRLIFEVVTTRFALEKVVNKKRPLRLKEGFKNGWLFPLFFEMPLVHS